MTRHLPIQNFNAVVGHCIAYDTPDIDAQLLMGVSAEEVAEDAENMRKTGLNVLFACPSRELLKAPKYRELLDQFVDNYSPGINPWLDNVYQRALDLLRAE